MLNLKKRLYKSKSKSKIFITILCIFGLLFSYSCSCKNRVSDPNETPINGGITNKKPDETPLGTFSMSAATDNVVASIVKESKTVGDIKISFVSANNYDYTMDYTVDDANETVEANKIDKTDFQVANNVLTAKESLLTKVKALTTDSGPAEKTITINFTFKANDASLKNNTQTLSVEVKLTHAQKIDDSNKDDVITTIFNAMTRERSYELGEVGSDKALDFKFGSGTFKTDTYTINNSTTQTASDVVFAEDNKKTDIAAELKRNLEFFLPQLEAISKVEFVNEAGINTDTYTITYNVTFSDDYEITPNPTEIKFAFKAAKQ